jgi:predicted anti-sigma-YlaC factor YlaD
MRCEDVREFFVDLIYDEGGVIPGRPDVEAHLEGCPTCRQELQELQQARRSLHEWQDERPLRPVAHPQGAIVRPFRLSAAWRVTRFAAVAAAVVLGFLALMNTEVSWTREGFSFKAHLFSRGTPGKNYYTRAEVETVLRQALADTEARMMETNRLMILQGLDTVEAERFRDLTLIEHRVLRGLGKNPY